MAGTMVGDQPPASSSSSSAAIMAASSSSKQPRSTSTRTIATAAPRINVPIPSFRIIDEASDPIKIARDAKGPSHTVAWRGFGYNNVKETWKRGEHYIRYVEPIEAELATLVEYDMDEQDKEWVDALNEERHKQLLDKISYELFEVIMDKLEKEWFELQKRIPVTGDLPAEDSRCSICDDGEGENANAIVFCDGCNLAVHQDCYGVPYIPEGQWLCRKCTVEPENPVDCVLCPSEAGAFKQTTSGAWAHLLCAIWIPEVGVANPVYMEPIEGVEGVPKARYKLVCSVCKMKNGACIQCDVKSCYVAFHVTCGRQAGYLASMKTLGTHGQLKAWCPKHMPASQAEQIQDRQDERSAEQFTMATSTSTTVAQSSRKRKHVEISGTLSARPEPGAMVKSARAHAKSYHFGAPLVPAIIVGRIVEYTQKVKVRTMNDVIERVCRYWSLKREARRGAPLLKRLYLEPWTASNSSKEQSDADRAKRLEYLIMVRNDLERVRMLAELARKREREKLRQANVLKQFVDEFLFPGATTLRVAFDRIKHLDKDSLFQDPVSREQAPDYYDVIKNPLCLAQIDERIDQYRYLLRIDFERDVLLVLDNAMLYNPPGNPYHQRAARMKKAVMPIIAELPESFEPSITQLQALVEVGTDGKDRLESLFAYELDPPRPPTPPPAPKRPRIQISAEEIRTRKEAKAREAKLALLNRPASMRSTRATQAVQEEVQRAAEIARQAEVAARKPIAARRERRHSARPQTDVSQPGTPTSDAEIIPLRRPQKGVAGLVPYSPTNARKRAERVQQTGLEMETVKPRDEFRRFDQGFILPEGSRRRGRPELVAPPPKPKPSRKRDQPKAAAGPSDATEVATAPLQTSEAELAPPKVTHSFQSPPETSQGPPATQQPAEPEQAPPQASGPSVADAVPPAPSAQEAVRAPSPALSDLTTLSSLSSLSDVGPEPKVANGAEPTTVPELRNVSEQSNITEPVVMPDRERKSQKQATVPPSRKSTRKNYAQSASNSGPVPSPPPVSEPTTKSRSTAGPTIHETQADDTQPRASHRLRRAAAAPHDQARAIPAVAADAPVEAAAANSATAPITDNGEKANNVMPRASVRVRRDAVDKGDAARTAAEVPQDTPANVAISGSAANAATDKDQPNDLFATKASSHARRGVASPDYQSFANATSSASKSSARQGTPERPVSADAIAEENHAIMPHATEAAAQVTSSTTTSTVTPSNRPKRSAARTVPAEAAVSNREQNEAASSGSSSLTTPSALPQRSKRGRAPAKPAVAEANEGKPSQQAQGTPASSSLSEVPSDLSAAAAEVINVAEQAIEAVKAKAPPAAKESRSSKRKVTGPEAVATEVDASENPAEGSARKKGKQPANSRKVHAEAASDDATRKNRLESLKGTNGTTPSNGWIDPYPEGTLVWAKLDGFPHYPAEVVSATDDYDDIPETVWTARPRSNEADDKGERLWLVRFYDNHQSYGWCPVKKLDVLGEDPVADAKYMSKQFVRKESLRKQVRDAYELAKGDMEIV